MKAVTYDICSQGFDSKSMVGGVEALIKLELLNGLTKKPRIKNFHPLEEPTPQQLREAAKLKALCRESGKYILNFVSNDDLEDKWVLSDSWTSEGSQAELFQPSKLPNLCHRQSCQEGLQPQLSIIS